MAQKLLDPDGPAPHVWPHWREAFRAWHVGRRGRAPARAATGQEPRGKGPGLDDLLRVGRVLATLHLLDDQGTLTRHGEMVLAVAMGASPRSGAAEGSVLGAEVLVKRLERHLRRAGIVRPASPRTAAARWRFTLQGGEEASHAYLVDSD